MHTHGYILYYIPDDKAYGGITFIIRSSIRHHKTGKYQREFLQTISILVKNF
jgi:hypothetical protein